MTINFVGLFGQTDTGEPSDESHLADALEGLGHTIRRIPRDEWREYVIENFPSGKYKGIPNSFNADINIIAKWHHFYEGKFIEALRFMSKGTPVFYWVWDSVDLGIDWHLQMAKAADLYLSGELGRAQEFRKHGIRFYYFQMDVVDWRIQFIGAPKSRESYKHEVVYLGTCDNQNGRVDLLKEINAKRPITVYGVNWQEWQKQGFDAHPAIFGVEANEVMSRSKIVLGTSCDPHLFGYWSNRVGRVLSNRSFLLQQYTPGMENFLHDWAHYYSTADEAIASIENILEHFSEWRARAEYSRSMWTSNQKMKDLCVLIERYRKEDNGKLWMLP